MIPAVALAATIAAGPLVWSAPAAVDPQPLTAIACPASTLCVAADRGGSVLWSTDPSGGPGRWHRADVDGAVALTGLSCPTATLCVAVDALGRAVTSVDPTAGAAAWTVAPIDAAVTQVNTDNGGSVLLRGVACASAALCVAVDAAGNAVLSTDPTGGTAAWTSNHIDTNPSAGCVGDGLTCQPPLVGIACPSSVRCVAIDFSGNVLTSAAPSVVAPWLSVPTVPGALSSLWSISCPTATLCATVNGIGERVITFNPAAPATELQRALPYSLDGIWCQSPSLCLAAAQSEAGISGLLGSTSPATASGAWSFSHVGGVNAIACPTGAQMCVAADDEGEIVAGVSTTSLRTGLRAAFLGSQPLPTIAALARRPRTSYTYTAPLPGQITVTWARAAKRSDSSSPAGTSAPIATATRVFSQAGTQRLTLTWTAVGRQLLKAASGPSKLTGTATFTAATGSVSVTRPLRLAAGR